MKREITETGGVLTRRNAIVTVHETASTAIAALDRLRTAPTLAEQIVRYFEELADRLRTKGFIVGPNLYLTPPANFCRTHEDWALAEEFSELRDAIHEVVADEHGHAARRLAPAAQLNAVARAFYAGRLAQERHLSRHEPDTERGIRDGRQREDARAEAKAAKEEKAAIWETEALRLARTMVVPTKKYTANSAAPHVRAKLAVWLEEEYRRLGRDFEASRDLPAEGTVRKAIAASKIVGRVR